MVKVSERLASALEQSSSAPEACVAGLDPFSSWDEDPLAKALRACAKRR